MDSKEFCAIDALSSIKKSPILLQECSPTLSAASSPKFAQSHIKFDILEDGTSHPRQCGDCQATHTSGHWCQDTFVHGGHICQKCYRRRKRSKANPNSHYEPPNRHCVNCNSTSTGSMWFKHQSIVGYYVCEPCYFESRKLVATEDDRTCGHCATKHSTRWYNCSKTGSLCRKCYRKKNLTKIEILPNGKLKRRSCVSCSSKETSSWHDTNDGFLCRHCFSKTKGMQIKRYCASCKIDQTSQWHTDHANVSGYICKGCYLRRRLTIENSPPLSTKSLSPELSHVLPSFHSVFHTQVQVPLSPIELKFDPNLPPIHAYLKLDKKVIMKSWRK